MELELACKSKYVATFSNNALAVFYKAATSFRNQNLKIQKDDQMPSFQVFMMEEWNEE